MRLGIALPAGIAAASILVACGGSEPPKPASTPPAAKAPAAAPADAAAGAQFGVAECDDYIKAYTDCVNSKVPDAARAQLQAALDQSKQAWQLAASNAEGRSSLGVACRQAQEAARASMKAYGCTF
jgi:hypothetical protein